MSTARDVLTPDALAMLKRIADSGSFAAAARAGNMVPSALTYRVRVIEDALDVLLFDRSSRQARLTEAGAELLREGERLLADIDAVANRVRRVATGWEPQFTIAADSIINRATLMEMSEAFFALNPPTRLKLRTETLSGTLDALTSGQADLSLGVVLDASSRAGLHQEAIGMVGIRGVAVTGVQTCARPIYRHRHGGQGRCAAEGHRRGFSARLRRTAVYRNRQAGRKARGPARP